MRNILILSVVFAFSSILCGCTYGQPYRLPDDCPPIEANPGYRGGDYRPGGPGYNNPGYNGGGYYGQGGSTGMGGKPSYNTTPGPQGMGSKPSYNTTPGPQGLGNKPSYNTTPGRQGLGGKPSYNTTPGPQRMRPSDSWIAVPQYQKIQPMYAPEPRPYNPTYYREVNPPKVQKERVWVPPVFKTCEKCIHHPLEFVPKYTEVNMLVSESSTQLGRPMIGDNGQAYMTPPRVTPAVYKKVFVPDGFEVKKAWDEKKVEQVLVEEGHWEDCK